MDYRNNPKFTKGEKCIFTHIVFTLSIILVLVIVFLIHLYVITHDLKEVFETRRSFLTKKEHSVPEYLPIGILFLNQSTFQNICNVLLLSWQWSIAPAHCLVMRSDPELSYLISAWKIHYTHNLGHHQPIGQHLCKHDGYNDTFANNIGLLQHDYIQSLQEYRIMKPDKLLLDEIYVASWNNEGHSGNNGTYEMCIKWALEHNIFFDDSNLITYAVKVIDEKKCTIFLTPVLELRIYEFCTIPKDELKRPLEWGAAIINLRKKQFIGFFTWGEREPQALPIVSLNITYYSKWLDSILL